jgi:hypothetical protein
MITDVNLESLRAAFLSKATFFSIIFSYLL